MKGSIETDIKGSIETADKFGLIFSMEKGGESGSINFSHPLTLLQTHTTHVIGFVNAICKEEVETPLAFELFLMGITGVSADFASWILNTLHVSMLSTQCTTQTHIPF
jgi:hypothetical protein